MDQEKPVIYYCLAKQLNDAKKHLMNLTYFVIYMDRSIARLQNDALSFHENMHNAKNNAINIYFLMRHLEY